MTVYSGFNHIWFFQVKIIPIWLRTVQAQKNPSERSQGFLDSTRSLISIIKASDLNSSRNDNCYHDCKLQNPDIKSCWKSFDTDYYWIFLLSPQLKKLPVYIPSRQKKCNLFSVSVRLMRLSEPFYHWFLSIAENITFTDFISHRAS